MNKIILIGNLAQDPEIKTAANGLKIANLRLAASRPFANKDGVRETDFFPVIFFRQTAELCEKYLAKGRKIAVEGYLQTRTYEAQDGSKRYVTEIIGQNLEFLSSNNSGGKADYKNANANVSEPAQATARIETEDDLPF